MPLEAHPSLVPEQPVVPPSVLDAVAGDYRRFAELGPPANYEEFLRERYRIDVSTEYAGLPIRNPWGKASGQLSMTLPQIREDLEAGLGFIVLKTVIAEDASGAQSMAAWAVREARMLVEPIAGRSGEVGWTVTWKGRGWWRSLDDYIQLLRDSLDAARGAGTLLVPSCKYHLPGPGETEWRVGEYEHTTRRLLDAWRTGGLDQLPMPLEKDFSPTLAGSDRAAAQERIRDWLREVPRLVRAAAPGSVRIGLKIFNALFDDDFQLDMLRTACGEGKPDFIVYANRLFDPHREFDGHRGVAYGGPDLSDRNLRVLRRCIASAPDHPAIPCLSATGNIASGRTALEYALLGARSFQLHTFFQLPLDQYSMTRGSRTQRALHELYFHPQTGLIVWMLHAARALNPDHRPLEDPVRLRDLVGRSQRMPAMLPAAPDVPPEPQ